MKAVRYHPTYCAEAKEELKVNPKAYIGFDTSHDLSVIDDDGKRHKIGTFKHADYASAVGELIEKHGLACL